MAGDRPRRGVVLILGAAMTVSLWLEAGAVAGGRPDPRFGEDGMVTLEAGPRTTGRTVAVQRDGRIVVAGRAVKGKGGPSTGHIVIARYGREGELDGSFSDDGSLSLDLGRDSSAGDLAVDPGGRILLAAIIDGNAAVIRLLPSGARDRTFAGDGIRELPAAAGVLAAVEVRPDGRIVAGAADAEELNVIGLRPSGLLDSSFAGDGVRSVALPPEAGVKDMALGPGGEIVFCGTRLRRGPHRFQIEQDVFVGRLRPNGGTSKGFSGDGIAYFDFADYESLDAVAVRPDGGILAGGHLVDHTSPRPVGNTDFLVLRLERGGSLDSGFGTNGRRVVSFPTDAGVLDLELSRGRRINLVGGTVAQFGDDGFRFARLLANGASDAAFSGDGRATVEFAAAGPSGGGPAAGVAIDPWGRAVAVGTAGRFLAVSRLTR